MIESVIIGAKRSPIGIKNGKMLGIRPDDLAISSSSWSIGKD